MWDEIDALGTGGLPDDVHERLDGRTTFDTVGRGFDPAALDLGGALRRGLPPRPDGDRRAMEIWSELAKAFGSHVVGPTSAPPLFATTYNRVGLKTHVETSRNWSGAVIAAPFHQKPFVWILATWRITEFRRPPSGGAKPYACSTWIGFDGHRRSSRSLPQIGTLQSVDAAGVPSVSAWTQWWWKGETRPTPVGAFPVRVGDRIYASLFVVRRPDGPRVLMTMAAVHDSGPPSFHADRLLRPDRSLNVRGLDVECVVERPKLVPEGTGRDVDPTTLPNFPLPAFDDITIRCLAFQEGSRTSRDMQGSRMLRMVHTQQPAGIERLAEPSRNADAAEITVRSFAS